jgi:GTP cyclohydrolase I
MTEEIRQLLEQIKTERDYERMLDLVMRVNKLWDEVDRRRNGTEKRLGVAV